MFNFPFQPRAGSQVLLGLLFESRGGGPSAFFSRLRTGDPRSGDEMNRLLFASAASSPKGDRNEALRGARNESSFSLCIMLNGLVLAVSSLRPFRWPVDLEARLFSFASFLLRFCFFSWLGGVFAVIARGGVRAESVP